ncbi:unnamed protein product, partial [Mesorhabditis belari]|uniref:Uncharacterized protein n=1 Tax=Mesorhabditis belari TaxID=2138241 RepID=A0AAF3J9K1_9BILA
MDFSEKPAFSRSTYREIVVSTWKAGSKPRISSQLDQTNATSQEDFQYPSFRDIECVFPLALSKEDVDMVRDYLKKDKEVNGSVEDMLHWLYAHRHEINKHSQRVAHAISALSENGMLPQKKLNNSTKMKKLQESHDDDLISMNSFSNLIAALMMDCYGQ